VGGGRLHNRCFDGPFVHFSAGEQKSLNGRARCKKETEAPFFMSLGEKKSGKSFSGAGGEIW